MSAAQRPFLTASNRCEPPGQTVALDEARSNELETLVKLNRVYFGKRSFSSSGSSRSLTQRRSAMVQGS
jgi:hypothetical protein